LNWLLALHLLCPLWEVCYRSDHFVRLADELNRYCRSTLFHFYLFYALIRYIRLSGSSCSFNDTLTYYLHSFRGYLHESVSVDRGTLQAVERIERPLCLFLLVFANVVYPNNGWYVLIYKGSFF